MRLQVDSEMNAMRTQQRTLARAVAWSVDTLMQDSENMDPRKRDALECLSYVRDVLTIGNVIRLDEDRLISHHSAPPATYVQVQATRENASATITAPPAPPTEPKSPRVMLSKRDSKPLTGLTRTPHVPQSTATSRPFMSSSTSRSSSTQKLPAVSAPATLNRFASPQNSSSISRPAPPWQRSPPSSSAGPRLPREHQRNENVPSSSYEGDTLQAAASTYPPSSGYPPMRTDSNQSGTRTAAPSVDPLGVLR